MLQLKRDDVIQIIEEALRIEGMKFEKKRHYMRLYEQKGEDQTDFLRGLYPCRDSEKVSNAIGALKALRDVGRVVKQAGLLLRVSHIFEKAEILFYRDNSRNFNLVRYRVDFKFSLWTSGRKSNHFLPLHRLFSRRLFLLIFTAHPFFPTRLEEHCLKM